MFFMIKFYNNHFNKNVLHNYNNTKLDIAPAHFILILSFINMLVRTCLDSANELFSLPCIIAERISARLIIRDLFS